MWSIFHLRFTICSIFFKTFPPPLPFITFYLSIYKYFFYNTLFFLVCLLFYLTNNFPPALFCTKKKRFFNKILSTFFSDYLCANLCKKGNPISQTDNLQFTKQKLQAISQIAFSNLLFFFFCRRHTQTLFYSANAIEQKCMLIKLHKIMYVYL